MQLNILQRQFSSILNQQLCMLLEVHLPPSFKVDLLMLMLIFCNPSIHLHSTYSLLLLSYTASVYIKMKKPNAAIRDATAALEVDLAIRFAYLNLALFCIPF